ncbi:MAG: hypothetical protein PHU03_01055, partial [Syntrophales bacterium]|nr:hypothetical protein [Syntrophales bacterium]
VERQHRGIAEALYLLSHVVIFVASQEKYADDMPSRLLCRMDSEGKPYYIVFNKADYRQTDDELVTLFRDRGLSIRGDRFFRIPFMNSSELSGETFMSAVRLCVDGIMRDCSPSALNSVRRDDLSRIREGLVEKTDRLLSSAESEEKAARSWLKELDALVGSTSEKLLEEMASRQDRRNLSALKKQLGQIFSAYDVLAKPRRYIMSIIKSPLRVLGIVGPESAGGVREDFLKAREKVNNWPIHAAMDRLNLLILETLSPSSTESPLFKALRNKDLPLKEDELEARILEEQEKLAKWLEATIRDLEAGLPKSKRLGIYSTSLIWGAAIISFQTVLGGGLALLELAFDTVLAPFITKGSVELFIYRELRSINREMNSLYQEGIRSIFEEQKERYVTVLESHLAHAGAWSSLLKVKEALEGET